MGDHAPASEARTRCDRKFSDLKFVYIEMFETRNLLISNFEYGTKGEKLGITLRLQKQELDVIEN